MKNSSASKASIASTASKASTASPLKILIITYYWPPCGGAGVQRWLKFVKYLPYFGWEPMVLTVDPKYATYPALDITLENEIDSKIQVFKTPATDYFKLFRRKSGAAGIPSAGFATDDSSGFFGKLARFVRGNFFIPDPRRGWNSYAYKKACSLVNDYGITHVITTSPPHSTQLIGLKLKKRFPHLKWIADFRDPWTDIYYYKNFYPARLSRAIDAMYEKRTLRFADIILTVGESLANHFTVAGSIPISKVIVIPNGYDSDDFKTGVKKSEDIAIITYSGTLSNQYPVKSLLFALKKTIESAINFRLRFVGTLPESIKTEILETIGSDRTEFIPYCNHTEAIGYILDSTVLLLIIPDHKGNRSIITGKLFEYLATGNPVLCIGPIDGDAARIIENSDAGKTFGYDNWEGMTKFLEVNLVNPKTYSLPKNYSRDYIAKKLSLGLQK